MAGHSRSKNGLWSGRERLLATVQFKARQSGYKNIGRKDSAELAYFAATFTATLTVLVTGSF